MPEESLIFYNLIESGLGINAAAFKDSERYECLERLINAANSMQGNIGDYTGINICIHVASSFVLLGCKDSNKYHEMEYSLSAKYKEVDPSVILTSAALYYILRKTIGRLEGEKSQDIVNDYIIYLTDKNEEKEEITAKGITKKLEYIIERFDRMNWMIGVDVMQTLDIPIPIPIPQPESQERFKKVWIFQENSPLGGNNWELKEVIYSAKKMP